MIIMTESGWQPMIHITHNHSQEALRLDRIWRDGWNKSAREYNELVAKTQEVYGRMMDAPLLPLIPEGETKVPGLRYDGNVAARLITL